ncbi:hypothetical protein MCBG_04360 [Micromonospora sp. M42]|nr:hypothetical protein MCBG_04360 [Micromonospora sp. M42]
MYVVPGQPGLHGERLLVVLREQADLTGLPAGTPGRAGRDARATEVYRRLVATADRTQGDLRRTLTDMRLKPTPYYLVNAIETDGGPAVRAWLSGRPEVARVLVSQRLRPLPALAPTARGDAPAPTGPAWNISLIGADRVWSELGVTGSGVVVGSSDSGVDGRHPALAGGFRGGDDSWYDPWEDRRAPADRGGHGTHTLGSAVGRDGIGVAPGASWVGCVNLDRNLGSPARYLDCLQFMLAPFPPGGNPLTDGRPARAPDVLTNSWGCPPLEGCDPGALRPATAALTAAGILVVAAAGNTRPVLRLDRGPARTVPGRADRRGGGPAAPRHRLLQPWSRAGRRGQPDLFAPGAACALRDARAAGTRRWTAPRWPRRSGGRGGADVVGEPRAGRGPGTDPGHPARHRAAGPAARRGLRRTAGRLRRRAGRRVRGGTRGPGGRHRLTTLSIGLPMPYCRRPWTWRSSSWAGTGCPRWSSCAACRSTCRRTRSRRPRWWSPWRNAPGPTARCCGSARYATAR